MIKEKKRYYNACDEGMYDECDISDDGMYDECDISDEGMSEKGMFICLLSCLGIVAIVAIILISIFVTTQREFEKNVGACNSMEDCEKYACLANIDRLKEDKSTNLLIEQNCLLKKAEVSRKG